MTKAAPAPLGATLIRKGGSTPAPSVPPKAAAPRVGTIAVTVRLDPDRYERLKAQATGSRRTNQDIIVEALDTYWRAEGLT